MGGTPFLTDAELIQAVANVLRLDVASLPPAFYNPNTGGGIIPDANQAAFRDIRGALLIRSFDISQILAWDRGKEYNLAIGKYWSLINGTGIHPYDLEAAEKLDRRKELKEVLVEVASGQTQPPTGVPNAISAGRMNTGTRAELASLRRFAGQGCPTFQGAVFGMEPQPPFYGGNPGCCDDGGY